MYVCMYVLSKKLGSYYFGISSSCALCWKECCNEHNCVKLFSLFDF